MISCDGIRRTPWGTVLATEETDDGGAYEIPSPLETTNYTIADRASGAIVDADGGADSDEIIRVSRLYAVLSLTVVRMLPVALALAGTRLARPTVLFMGWFGPRGLASIVLGLVYLEQQTQLPGEGTIRLAVMATVLLSIVAHGISAMPGIRRYAREAARLPPTAPEHAKTEVSAARSS
jgi:hypothetical protein